MKDIDEYVVGVTRNRHVGENGGIIILDEYWNIVSDRHGNEGSNLDVTGIYTHFAAADEPMEDGSLNAYSRQQLERFKELRSCFDEAIPAHVANSAMSLLAPEAYFNMIREGISLYGYPPVHSKLPFRPAMTWKTEVVHVKQIEAGESIGYGRSFAAKKPKQASLWAS